MGCLSFTFGEMFVHVHHGHLVSSIGQQHDDDDANTKKHTHSRRRNVLMSIVVSQALSPCARCVGGRRRLNESKTVEALAMPLRQNVSLSISRDVTCVV